MKPGGVLFFHGYGLRGRIWQPIRDQLGDACGITSAADLEAGSAAELIAQAKTATISFAEHTEAPVVLVGHSMGAVAAALAAQELDHSTVAGVIMMAPPHGERENVPGAFLRFLLRYRLLPPALVRPRFFSNRTPVDVQKRIFASAVPEAPGLQELTFQRRWFHTDLITAPLSVPSLLIASGADQIVPAEQSVAMGELLGSRVELIPATREIGHDDFFAAPAIIRETATTIEEFCESLR
jgi:pimeloyl-ACP methyl ester carboxylesterase